MTPESQRIAIAKTCGWKISLNEETSEHQEYWYVEGGGSCGTYGSKEYAVKALPNYLTDLNAMHEAEKQLIAKSQQDRFMYYLQQGYASDQFWCIAHATAAQRAEAFLRTLNLWKDDE
jgi:hypothetical protein